jgi:hypothetical protein
MNNQPDQNDVSAAPGLLRDSISEEEQRIRKRDQLHEKHHNREA